MADFCTAIAATGLKMDSAVSNSVDGTIVSVVRDCSQGVTGSNLQEVLGSWLKNAETELEKTPDQLKDPTSGKMVLKDAGVVDSGAKGFMYIVQGMRDASVGKLDGMEDAAVLNKSKVTGDAEDVQMSVDHNVTDTKYQFCTEAVIVLKDGASKDDVLKSFSQKQDEGLGDSVAVVGAPTKGGGQMAKLHMHSNDPQAIFDHALTFSADNSMLEKV